MRFKPSKNELFAKNSTLGIILDEDSNMGFGGYIFDRKTNLIISDFKVRVNTIPLIDNLKISEKQNTKVTEGSS